MNAVDIAARGLATRALGAQVALASPDGATGVGTVSGGTMQNVADAAAVPISNYGSTGTDDDSLVLQAALDDLDGSGRALGLVGPVNLRGNVYLGNNLVRFNGWPINCLIDEAFTERGIALNTNQGVILTKSAPLWDGEPAPPVSIEFLDPAVINTIRTVDTGTVAAGLLLENVAGFRAGRLTVTATGTGTSVVTPLDFFMGVQGVRIEALTLVRNIGSAGGGFWIRSFDPRSTSDIVIGRILISGDGSDEFVSIFNSADPSYDVHDVHIGEIIGTVDGGSGVVLSVFRNAGAYDPAKMQNITIGLVKIRVNSLALNRPMIPQIVKLDASAAHVGKIAIDFAAPAFPPELTGIVGVRGPAAGKQTTLPYVGELDFKINSAPAQPSGQADIAYGGLDFGRFVVRGSGSGWKYAGRYLRSIADARVNDVSLNYAFDGVESVAGYVEGRMNNVWSFKGTHVINVDRFSGTFWWFHNGVAPHWNNASPTALSYEAEVRISGDPTTKSISRIVMAQSNPANPVPVNVKYRASNPNNINIGSPDTAQNKAYFPVGQYSAVIVNGSIASRRGRTTVLAVTGGAITPVFEYHLLSNGAFVSDILGPNGAPPYDGQLVRLRMDSGTGTLRHNTGAAGTKTYACSGADVTLTDTGWTTATYNAAAGRWEVEPLNAAPGSP